MAEAIGVGDFDRIAAAMGRNWIVAAVAIVVGDILY